MKSIIQRILKLLAKAIIKKYKPEVIGITGSVGKSSTKEAIYTVLRGKFRVRRSEKSYNNEIGLPLTILGKTSGNKNVFKWLWIFLGAIKLLLARDKQYPQILVLEMGADRPGDIRYLLNIAPIKIGVLTAIGPVHLEFFGNLERIIREKQLIISQLKPDDFALINGDDENVKDLTGKTKAKVISYGFKPDADVSAGDFKISHNANQPGIRAIEGVHFKLSYQGNVVPVFLPNVIGPNHIYAALAAAACGIVYDLNLLDIAESLRYYVSPPGRMGLILGIKHTLIIDDTYNSSPQAAKMALDILGKLAVPGKKIACLGDMLELGAYTEEGHQEVGKQAAKAGIDMLVIVGEKARGIGRGAEDNGFRPDAIFTFPDNVLAGKFIQSKLKEGDAVLVKGSQGVRLEKVVKEIMAEPMRACELLVRQDESWVCR